MLSANLSALFYLISGILFILALRGLSSPETSRQGNYFGMVGMTIAIIVTFLSVGNFSTGLIYVAVLLLIGGSIGAFIAFRIPMTAMPELVAGFHSLVGLAAVFVAISAFLKPEVFNCSKHGCLNFHPALLPINRGWYPHVFSIIDGTPTGVTLHFIDEHTDTGPIIAQKIVPIKPTDTAKAIYDREKYEIISLFKEKWDDIRNNKLTPIPQDQSKAVHHSIKEIHALDEINLEKQYKARDLINLLRARSFGNRGFAYYELDGEKIYLNLRLSYQNRF